MNNKNAAIRELEQLAMQAARRKHPTNPHLAPRKFRDNSANNLTKCITSYLSLKGAFVSRLNNTGIYDARRRQYRPGTNRRGLPDVVCTYQGKSLFIEIKYGSDKLSAYQQKIRDEQIASGGEYFVATNFEMFKKWFDNINLKCFTNE
jgi:hypothetical protein